MRARWHGHAALAWCLDRPHAARADEADDRPLCAGNESGGATRLARHGVKPLLAGVDRPVDSPVCPRHAEGVETPIATTLRTRLSPPMRTCNAAPANTRLDRRMAKGVGTTHAARLDKGQATAMHMGYSSMHETRLALPQVRPLISGLVTPLPKRIDMRVDMRLAMRDGTYETWLYATLWCTRKQTRNRRGIETSHGCGVGRGLESSLRGGEAIQHDGRIAEPVDKRRDKGRSKRRGRGHGVVIAMGVGEPSARGVHMRHWWRDRYGFGRRIAWRGSRPLATEM